MLSTRVLYDFCLHIHDISIITVDLSLALPFEGPFHPIPHPPNKRQKAPDLTRDQRRDICLLHAIGWKYKDIHHHIGATYSQIQTSCSTKATPTRRSGRPPILSQAQVEELVELVEFVCASAYSRLMPFERLAIVLDFGVKKGLFDMSF